VSYTTAALMEARFGTAELAQLTDRVSGAVVDADVLAGGIAAADALITPYLHAYDLAMVAAAPDPILGEIALHLARAALYVSGMPEDVAAAQKGAMQMLRDISSGVIRLRVGSPAAAVDTGAVEYAGPDATFTDASMAGY
jgi:phage gp36-like protein